MSERGKAEARAQYRVGALNRRAAAEAENSIRAGAAPDDLVELLCTCGRDDCDEVILVPLAAYERIREKSYRFVVAPEHETEIDDVIAVEDDYSVVEVRARFRLETSRALQ